MKIVEAKFVLIDDRILAEDMIEIGLDVPLQTYQVSRSDCDSCEE